MRAPVRALTKRCLGSGYPVVAEVKPHLQIVSPISIGQGAEGRRRGNGLLRCRVQIVASGGLHLLYCAQRAIATNLELDHGLARLPFRGIPQFADQRKPVISHSGEHAKRIVAELGGSGLAQDLKAAGIRDALRGRGIRRSGRRIRRLLRFLRPHRRGGPPKQRQKDKQATLHSSPRPRGLWLRSSGPDRDNLAAHHRRDLAHLRHQLVELLGIQRLHAVGQPLVGLMVHSTMSPSAPTATAARDSGVTLLRLPVPWLGSTTIGRWLSRCTAGTMLRSSVLRVWSAKVRTPRSHSTTL